VTRAAAVGLRGAAKCLLLVGALLAAGCAAPAPTEEDAGRVSKPSDRGMDPDQVVVLLEADVRWTPQGQQSWPIQVPANATDVFLDITYTSFFHVGLHLALEGCGGTDWDGPGGSLGGGPGTWTYPVCGTATAGEHAFTATLDHGTLEGKLAVTATVPRASAQPATNATA
jgi:hypothetical protein